MKHCSFLLFGSNLWANSWPPIRQNVYPFPLLGTLTGNLDNAAVESVSIRVESATFIGFSLTNPSQPSAFGLNAHGLQSKPPAQSKISSTIPLEQESIAINRRIPPHHIKFLVFTINCFGSIISLKTKLPEWLQDGCHVCTKL